MGKNNETVEEFNLIKLSKGCGTYIVNDTSLVNKEFYKATALTQVTINALHRNNNGNVNVLPNYIQTVGEGSTTLPIGAEITCSTKDGIFTGITISEGTIELTLTCNNTFETEGGGEDPGEDYYRYTACEGCESGLNDILTVNPIELNEEVGNVFWYNCCIYEANGTTSGLDGIEPRDELMGYYTEPIMMNCETDFYKLRWQKCGGPEEDPEEITTDCCPEEEGVELALGAQKQGFTDPISGIPYEACYILNFIVSNEEEIDADCPEVLEPCGCD
jgi:hypothetical protein